MATFSITADTKWSSDWSCEDWIAYHKALKAELGKDQADQTWLQAWNEQSAWASNYNWCKYGAAFNSYVNAEKLPVTHLLADLFSGGTRVGENVIGAAESTSKVPINVANVLKWLVPTVLILVVIGAIIYFGKKYQIFKLA